MKKPKNCLNSMGLYPNFSILKSWLWVFTANVFFGLIGAYFIQSLWQQNELDFKFILTHVISILTFVLLGYRFTPTLILRFKLPLISKRDLFILYLFILLIYSGLKLLGISHMFLTSLFIFFSHWVFFKTRNVAFLLLSLLILGFEGARLPIIFFILPLFLIKKYRKLGLVFILPFILYVGVIRSDAPLDLISLGSIFGVEWRDFFLLHDDNIQIHYEGLSHYLIELFILPFPFHSLLIDTIEIRMSSIPRLLASELNLEVSGLRFGILNEVRFVWGYYPMILCSFIIGAFLKLTDQMLKVSGLNPVTICFVFSGYYTIIGQADVLLYFIYPALFILIYLNVVGKN